MLINARYNNSSCASDYRKIGRRMLMKEKIVRFMEKASVDTVEKVLSYGLWGEREIPKVILDEIKGRKQN